MTVFGKLPSVLRQTAGQMRSELIQDEYKADADHPLRGLCYVVSEAYFHLRGGYDNYEVHRLTLDNGTHWFLRARDTGHVVDLTADQFDGPLDYSDSVATGFMTEEPCERTQQLLDAVEGAL